MVNYQNGKIYMIWSASTNLRYYGSTTAKLSRRFQGHKDRSNSYTSKLVFDCGDAKIELGENDPCNSKEELTAREGYYIRNNECVNKQIAGRSKKQYREDSKDKITEYQKQYRKNNKDKITEYHKQYYEKNKENYYEKYKEYREKNKEKIAEYHKQYNEKNKDKLTERKKEYYRTNKDKINQFNQVSVFGFSSFSSV